LSQDLSTSETVFSQVSPTNPAVFFPRFAISPAIEPM
jgi:hypothetical protein